MYFELFLVSILIILILFIFCISLFCKNKKYQKEHHIVNQKIAYIQKRVGEINLFKQKVETYSRNLVEKANAKAKQCIDNMEQVCETKKEIVNVLEAKINQLVLQQNEIKQNLQYLISKKTSVAKELDLLIDRNKAVEQQFLSAEHELKNQKLTSTSPNSHFDNIEQLINIVDNHLDNNQHLR